MEGGSNGSRQFYKGWLYSLPEYFRNSSPATLKKFPKKQGWPKGGVFMFSECILKKRKYIVRLVGIGITLLVLNGTSVYAQTVPDVRGTWITGPSTGTETCPGEGTGPDNDAGGVSLIFNSQTGSSFSGNYQEQVSEQGFIITEIGNLSGTVMPNGTFTGMNSYEVRANPGNILVYQGGGTFTGSVSGNTMNVVADWVDTFDIEGPPCSGHSEFPATRSGTIPPPIMIRNPAGVGDLNGDGTDDMVWRNTVTGDVAVWLGNGLKCTHYDGGDFVSAVPLLIWVNKGQWVI